MAGNKLMSSSIGVTCAGNLVMKKKVVVVVNGCGDEASIWSDTGWSSDEDGGEAAAGRMLIALHEEVAGSGELPSTSALHREVVGRGYLPSTAAMHEEVVGRGELPSTAALHEEVVGRGELPNTAALHKEVAGRAELPSTASLHEEEGFPLEYRKTPPVALHAVVAGSLSLFPRQCKYQTGEERLQLSLGVTKCSGCEMTV